MIFALMLTVIDYNTGNELLRINAEPTFRTITECREAGVTIAKNLTELFRLAYHNASTNIVCHEGTEE